jgi:hypothetical protein
LLAWVRGPKKIIGGREFRGFHVWDSVTDFDDLKGLSAAYKTSLTQLAKCDPYAFMFLEEKYRGSLKNDTLTESVCDENCATSLESWFDNVGSTCAGYNVSGAATTKYGGRIWSGWNETCLKDTDQADFSLHIKKFNVDRAMSLIQMWRLKLGTFGFRKIIESDRVTRYAFVNNYLRRSTSELIVKG